MESAAFKRVDSDFAVFYGFANRLRNVYENYRSQSIALYVDLGYWKRRINNRYDGYYKFSINDRHPTQYFEKNRHSDDRLEALGVKIEPWKKNEDGPVIIAGMSEKAARAENLEHQVWERQAFEQIRRRTQRQIIYRPKPNCCRSRPIKGAAFDRLTPTVKLFETAHAVVCRHSNMAVEAICAGVPAFVEAGVALPMSSGALKDIENPKIPKGRRAWASAIAYCQWSLEEIAEGKPFLHLKKENLIP
jgi:hypothetical protein